MIVIPAIDIIDGRVVRLTKGEFNSVKSYNDNPVELLSTYLKAGFKNIHMVDLTGSRDSKINSETLIKEITEKLDINLQFGGGVRSADKVQTLLDAGVNKVVIGSLPFTAPNEFSKLVETVDPDKMIIAADVKDGMVMIKGWTEQGGRKLNEYIDDMMQLGFNRFLCTDINRDGMLNGVNTELYKSLLQSYPQIKLTASGGVSSVRDLEELATINCHSVVVGKALLENKITLEELKRFVG